MRMRELYGNEDEIDAAQNNIAAKPETVKEQIRRAAREQQSAMGMVEQV